MGNICLQCSSFTLLRAGLFVQNVSRICLKIRSKFVQMFFVQKCFVKNISVRISRFKLGNYIFYIYLLNGAICLRNTKIIIVFISFFYDLNP